ncbi:MAG: alkaline phosphatase family protein [Gemmatimonadetes bacterium]|nr:alkaline phosphatase family protein [Gemmatimonadota bacterium]
MSIVLDDRFIRPRYNGHCFADLPATIKWILTGQGAPSLDPTLLTAVGPCDTVVLFFIDSFGWRFFERYQDRYPFLSDIGRGGSVNRITSQFPSTTAAHITCIHTGQPVGHSGVFEWQYYEPSLDAIITPLPFARADSKQPNCAQVCRTADLIEDGLFGPLPLSQRFLDRVGNLVILPFAGESVWWYEKDKFEMTKHGAHGGLTPDEVEIPLLLFYF